MKDFSLLYTFNFTVIWYCRPLICS